MTTTRKPKRSSKPTVTAETKLVSAELERAGLSGRYLVHAEGDRIQLLDTLMRQPHEDRDPQELLEFVRSMPDGLSLWAAASDDRSRQPQVDQLNEQLKRFDTTWSLRSFALGMYFFIYISDVADDPVWAMNPHGNAFELVEILKLIPDNTDDKVVLAFLTAYRAGYDKGRSEGYDEGLDVGYRSNSEY